MYGKHFTSTYTGSMLGAGPDVFAVWGYVIAHTVDSQVELNPHLLAHLIGSTPEAMQAAIDYLCAPDPRSRSKLEEGRRLLREGEYAYRVPTHDAYRSVRNEDERREYNRIKKTEQRTRDKSNGVKARVIDKHRQSTMSAQAEAEANSDTETRKAVLPTPVKRSNGKAALLLAEIKGLAEESQTLGYGASRFIRKAAVEELGADVYLAYQAVGGAERILAATGKDWGFLTKDFADALEEARK